MNTHTPATIEEFSIALNSTERSEMIDALAKITERIQPKDVRTICQEVNLPVGDRWSW